MSSWSSSIDSEEQAYNEMRLQELQDEFQFLNQIRPQTEPSYEQLNVQPPYETQVPPVQVSSEQVVTQSTQEAEFFRVPLQEQIVDSYPVHCYCGYAVEVVVQAEGNNIGRRIQRCPAFPNGCNYTEWIDQPLCPRGIAYCNELERENRRVRSDNEQLRLNIRRRP